MFFRRQPNRSTIPAETAITKRQTLQHSSAETAHLVGPGCVQLQAGIPIWKPVEGRSLSLHPEYLKRLFCYGNVDLSTTCLQLFWRRGIVVSFLSQNSAHCLGILRPIGSRPGLARLQHLSAADPVFALNLAKQIVIKKIGTAIEAMRYYQQQGRGSQAGTAIQELKQLTQQADRAQKRDALHGVEGKAAAVWFRLFSGLLPACWNFERRISRPPIDPVNALLSLGYTLATTRCAALIAAYDLDPDVGFLHEIRPGRPSLACDLVETLRIPLVDRMVLVLLTRKQLTPDSFVIDKDGCRLQPSEFKTFLEQFEKDFNAERKPASFQRLTCQNIDRWISQILKADSAGRQ